MAEENLLTSERTDTEVFCYGAKHLEKGRLKDSSGNYITDGTNRIKFFTIVEEK